MSGEQTSKPLRLGIAGLGTVGTGLIQMILKNQNSLEDVASKKLVITGVSARTKNRKRDVSIEAYQWFDDPVSLAKSSEVDLFIELIGGEDGPALEAVTAALNSGKSVVTANKAMLAKHGVTLARLAEENGLSLNYEASIAGGIPIVKALRESFSGNRIDKLSGILNGTSNYILTQMHEKGADFAVVLKDAQEKGYAEADPTFDIGGIDAAHKLSLLTSLGFGVAPSFEEVDVEGIEAVSQDDMKTADELGYRIKLLGVVTRTANGIEQRVHPAMIAKSNDIASVNGVTNCVQVEGDFVGKVLLVGPGAGAGATASSVMSDIVDIARGLKLPTFGRSADKLTKLVKAPLQAHEGGYYVRLDLADKIGVFAAVAQRMAEQEISLKSIVQHQGKAKEVNGDKVKASMPVVIITHRTTEQAIKKACDMIERDGHVLGPPRLIRIER